jgi:hypothetical protein
MVSSTCPCLVTRHVLFAHHCPLCWLPAEAQIKELATLNEQLQQQVGKPPAAPLPSRPADTQCHACCPFSDPYVPLLLPLHTPAQIEEAQRARQPLEAKKAELMG